MSPFLASSLAPMLHTVSPLTVLTKMVIPIVALKLFTALVYNILQKLGSINLVSMLLAKINKLLFVLYR